ncbi:Delta(1)-pyrroline-2-carboxylate reductase [Neobacillus rhizosphaerae]|uniref:Delta(1)-pyrroline-2-carboxylate reductase n=1 Tax=Neobacillus rhizosphaerae TaxID=2880965 RepID=A0ABM9EW00_9BACI|nr:ornithine cyclodeaminase family protein [Neobacillus rhizosphaerae]CAH2716814.1 Delta(1)-pyrroline-2-carboxylate reductase [Neobacillus rhizosphaerae]
MLVLTKEDIKKVFTMKDAIEADKDALRIYSAGKCVSPLRVNIDIPKEQGQSLFMPAYVEEFDATGIKIVSVFPKNIEKGKPSVPAQMILLDGTTGEVCAILDGTYLTQLRTGAVQGAATDILAKKDAKIGVLFGTGGQAATQLEAMVCVRNLEEVRVFDINYERAKEFAETMQRELAAYDTEIVAVENGNEAVRNADIITCVTTSRRPVFDGTLVKKGAHVNGVGAYTPQMQELDENIVKNADKVFFDTKEGVLAEAGDFLIPMEKGIVSEQDFNGELGEVILGQILGRETDEEITLFKTVGAAVLDVVTAHQIYKKAIENNVGNVVEI